MTSSSANSRDTRLIIDGQWSRLPQNTMRTAAVSRPPRPARPLGSRARTARGTNCPAPARRAGMRQPAHRQTIPEHKHRAGCGHTRAMGNSADGAETATEQHGTCVGIERPHQPPARFPCHGRQKDQHSGERGLNTGVGQVMHEIGTLSSPTERDGGWKGSGSLFRCPNARKRPVVPTTARRVFLGFLRLLP